MFFNADDDEQDFVSSGGGSKKLANLFGMDKASGKGGNSSLTYTAPKEPKKKAEAAPQGNSPAVVVASVVQAYKYVDNKYASQGKLGAALLANHSAKDYRILLYVNKQQQVTNAKVTTAFTFNIQENNYASFYDDARQTWSLLFDSTESAQKFAKEIAIAKANAVADALTDVVKQDLALGEGGPLDQGDSVEVKYSGWLLTNFTLSQTPFDSNVASDKLFRFKVGKGKVIKGWDQGMVGLKKGGKRVLVIPPSLGYGAQGVADRIPANSTLVFEVEVVRVKLAKGDSSQESPASTPSVTPAPTPAPAAAAMTAVPALPMEQDELEDAGVKGRTRSINEQLNHTQAPHSNKAKLISRMARMGQPMLPFQGAVPAQTGEEESDMQHQQMEEQQQQQQQQAFAAKPALPSKPAAVQGMNHSHPQVMMTQPGVTMVGNQPVMVGEPMMAGMVQPMQQPQYQQQQQPPFQQQPQQQQPAFLQNLPGAQQLAVYQNPNAMLQQQQQQQQQHLLQQQAQAMGMPQPMPAQPPVYSAPPPPPPPPLVSTVPTPPTSSADSLAPVLLTETRQQNTEVRLSISKMSDKVDTILTKVENMNPGMMGAGMPGMGAMSPYSGGMSAPTMEASVLMHNITRIVQDNERLKKEVYEQSSKVQEQNEKINTLLEKNQKYVEQSQNMLEQRNEGYKSSASQSQARVLTLEQEKVSLATDLSTASAQITTLQLELGDYRKKEGELKQKLQMTSSSGTEAKEELERLRLMKEENEQKIAMLTTTLREEKQARKQVESKISHNQEELLDVKSTNETLERNILERKKKSAEERRKLEEDMEDAKINYETTIEGLREKLRRQKNSTDAETENKMSKIEEDISNDWKHKSERMLASATDKHNRQLADVKEEKEELARKVAELEKKLTLVRSSGSNTEQEMNALRDELEESKAWKGKYDNLRKQASSMKEKYEKRIEELETEKEEEEEKLQELEERTREQRQQFLQQIQQLRSQQTTSATPVQTSSPPADVTTEVKKIMNKVFQTLRGEIDAGESYQGSQVLASILNVIKQTTLELVSGAAAKKEKEDEEEDDDEEEEEEEEESEEDEEEEEAEKEEEKKGDSETIKKEEIEVKTSVKDITPEPQVTPPPKTEEQKVAAVPDSLPADTVTQVPISQQSSQPSIANSNSNTSTPATPPEDVDTSAEMQKAASQTEEPKEIEHQETGDKMLGEEPESESSPTSLQSNDNAAERKVEESVPEESEEIRHQENGVSSSTDTETGDKMLEEESEIENSPTSLQSNDNVAEKKGEKSVPEVDDDLTDDVAQETLQVPEKESESVPVVVNGHDQSTDKDDNGNAANAQNEEDEEDDDIFSPAKEEEKSTPPTPTKAAESSPKTDKPVSPTTDTTSREPPPLFDDDEEEEDSPLFGKDSNVADTFGPAFESKSRSQSTISSSSVNAESKAATTPVKKVDLGLDEDNKPQPPPPLFGDDSDDDDLDWLS